MARWCVCTRLEKRVVLMSRQYMWTPWSGKGWMDSCTGAQNETPITAPDRNRCSRTVPTCVSREHFTDRRFFHAAIIIRFVFDYGKLCQIWSQLFSLMAVHLSLKEMLEARRWWIHVLQWIDIGVLTCFARPRRSSFPQESLFFSKNQVSKPGGLKNLFAIEKNNKLRRSTIQLPLGKNPSHFLVILVGRMVSFVTQFRAVCDRFWRVLCCLLRKTVNQTHLSQRTFWDDSCHRQHNSLQQKIQIVNTSPLKLLH